MTNRIISAAIPLCFFCLGATCHAEDKITLNYNERPPYIVPAADGSATGLTATPAANAFSTAGIPVTWTKIPPNRQLIVVQENKSANCAIGWFKNSERETFAKFS
ncbi:MAG: hypothetical protein KGM99_05860, partial [Burkholderiales bacterium]|nr:hypothetical protein [Burkholderiales bacterium]